MNVVLLTAKQESEDIGSAILSILSKFFEKLKSGGKKLFEEFKLWVDNVLKGLRKELGIAEFGGADGFITKTLAEDFFGVLRNVRKVEDEIRALDIEKAIIFDSKGNPLVELIVGKVGSVNLTFKDILKARQKILVMEVK